MKYRFIIPIFILALALVFKVTTGKTADIAHEDYAGCRTSDFTGLIDQNEKEAYVDGKRITLGNDVLAYKNAESESVLGVATTDERWIEVDLSEQKVRAWEGNRLYLESLVSTGLPGYDTPIGEFRIWIKLRATKMEGGQGRLYYYLPNVPYVMFFSNSQVPAYRGYSLHGTYWHNDFGRVHSHGCVNLPTSVAEKLYYWTSPVLPSGKSVVRADAGNVGTRIVIHE